MITEHNIFKNKFLNRSYKIGNLRIKRFNGLLQLSFVRINAVNANSYTLGTECKGLMFSKLNQKRRVTYEFIDIKKLVAFIE